LSVDSSLIREPSTFELLTSPGPAAIAVIRLRGAAVVRFIDRHIRTRQGADPQAWKPGDVRRAELVDAPGAVLDDLLVSIHAQPPEWDVRLHLHGSPALVNRCRQLLVEAGFVESSGAPADLWNTGDAIEAETYALLPRMLTVRGTRWLLLESEKLRDELRRLLSVESIDDAQAACRALAAGLDRVEWFARPARVALIGPPNAGKSTLTNALADQPISLASPVPGTTRDWVDAPGEVNGFPVVWVDTAGLRHSDDALEAAAIERTRAVASAADAIVVVLDATPAAAEARRAFIQAYGDIRPAAVALNKADLPCDAGAVAAELPGAWRPAATAVSSTQRSGLEGLLSRLADGLRRDERRLELPGAFTERQVRDLQAAAGATDLKPLRDALRSCLGTIDRS
jgi:tRNA modification GTPase